MLGKQEEVEKADNESGVRRNELKQEEDGGDKNDDEDVEIEVERGKKDG